jgi:hypothetical protein
MPQTANKQGSKEASRTRADGRKQFLIYLPPDLIKEVKKAALDQDTHAYDVAEEALRNWLARRRRKGRPK